MSTKVQRPDKLAFEKEFNSLKQKLEGKLGEQKKAQDALQKTGPTKNDPEWQKLLDELNAAKKARDAARAQVQDAHNEVRALETEHKKKVAEITALRPKQGPRTEEEFDRQIEKLEKLVETGEMKLVDEKRTVNEISNLKKAKRSVSGIAKLEAEASALKQTIAEKRKAIDDSALKQANADIAKINEKLDARKASRQQESKAKNELWNVKNQVQSEVKQIRDSMTKLREEFNAKLTAFREHAAAQRREREEEERKQKESAAREKKLAEAKNKLEAAKEPAFAAQIAKAQNLIAVLDPSYDKKTTAATSAVDTSSIPENAVLINRPKPEAVKSRKELKRSKAPSAPKSDKLRLDVGVIDDLSALNISIPRNSSEVEDVKNKLLEKIKYYEDNNDRVTKERVERAEENLHKVEKELEEPKAASPATEPKAE